MSVLISEPINLPAPVRGTLRIVSSPGDDRVVIVIRSKRGTHSLELDPPAAPPRAKKARR